MRGFSPALGERRGRVDDGVEAYCGGAFGSVSHVHKAVVSRRVEHVVGFIRGRVDGSVDEKEVEVLEPVDC